jgi:Spy/CpxP family protein refolding chaperone
MNAKAKIILHMGVTLIIGIVIGAMLNRAIVQKHIRDIMEMRAAGRFVPGIQGLLNSATSEQAPKIKEAFEKHRKSLAEIHERFGREIRTAMDDLKKEMEPLLTPEQKKRFETMLPGPPRFLRGGREGFPMGGPPFPGGFGIEWFKDRLKLSDDQLAKIKDIFSRYRKPVGPRPGGEPGREPAYLESDLSKMEAEVEGVLTEEQKVIFRQMREERRRPPFGEDPPPLPE